MGACRNPSPNNTRHLYSTLHIQSTSDALTDSSSQHAHEEGKHALSLFYRWGNWGRVVPWLAQSHRVSQYQRQDEDLGIPGFQTWAQTTPCIWLSARGGTCTHPEVRWISMRVRNLQSLGSVEHPSLNILLYTMIILPTTIKGDMHNVHLKLGLCLLGFWLPSRFSKFCFCF